MNLYTITLKNKKDNSIKKRNIEKLTFPEVVQGANMLRSNLGFDWEIVSIVKKGEMNG